MDTSDRLFIILLQPAVKSEYSMPYGVFDTFDKALQALIDLLPGVDVNELSAKLVADDYVIINKIRYSLWTRELNIPLKFERK